ncbi:GNAT family N-acetyltransferase [Phaeobacter sp.]|uniref:GNAT family N-acetyltransferase n=1 Tax=Phaeobacter sp. TaxID=1902409 RepID=UPI0025E84E90|nr:GNAT family N-acetyltransferase [Phaeobacter sp.]
MDVKQIAPDDAHLLMPLLLDLHALHVTHQPARYPANPDPDDLLDWLTRWLRTEGVHALGAQSPTGAVMGYLIYEIETRPTHPLSFGGCRAMVHHVAVAPSFRRIGIGKAMMTHMRNAALARGADHIAASYAPFNAASAGLMAAMGLTPVVTLAEWRAPSDGSA